MKEAIVHVGPRVTIHDVPIPVPVVDEVLIKVVVSGTNPKDYKMAEWGQGEKNSGDDMAGVIHAVGSNVTEFHPGDRVAAMHRLRAAHGSYAEYAIAPAHTTFHIPASTSLEEAATVPLAAMTAAVGLFVRMQLPQPFTPATKPTPLLVYGAASAVGSYAVKLATHSNIHPLICIAGHGIAHVETLIDRSKGDTVIDYRGASPDAIADAIRRAVPAQAKLEHAFDCVVGNGSYQACCEALSRDPANNSPTGKSQLTMVLRVKDYAWPAWVTHSDTKVGSVQDDRTYGSDDPNDTEFGYAWYRLFGRGLLGVGHVPKGDGDGDGDGDGRGWLVPHPWEVIPGGLGAVEMALRNLKEGRASAKKFLVRIGETEGLER